MGSKGTFMCHLSLGTHVIHTIKAVPHNSSFLPPIPTCFNFASITTTNYSIHTYKEKEEYNSHLMIS